MKFLRAVFGRERPQFHMIIRGVDAALEAHRHASERLDAAVERRLAYQLEHSSELTRREQNTLAHKRRILRASHN